MTRKRLLLIGAVLVAAGIGAPTTAYALMSRPAGAHPAPAPRERTPPPIRKPVFPPPQAGTTVPGPADTPHPPPPLTDAGDEEPPGR
ncbi:hypothetical protein [Actinoplanes sp. NPDC049265]|uniref:hypothetical protein n=1 Tax=Actinoplanes sp. NPDC049265 TaxID=3363902 RepID=UPI00371D27B5